MSSLGHLYKSIMKVVVATNAFKGSLTTATEGCLRHAGESSGRRLGQSGSSHLKGSGHWARISPGGMTAIFSICRKPLTLTESMTDAVALLTDTAKQVIHLFDAGNALRHRSP